MRLRLLIIFTLLSVFAKSQIQTGSFAGLGGACAGWTVYPPSCAPGCDAKMVISFPPVACYAGVGIAVVLPYNISVNPTGTCAAPAVPTVTFNPGTYTISINACACISSYFLILTDNGSPLFNTANLPVTAPSIQRLGVSTRSVDCAGACTGTIGATYFNTTGPYNFTLFASGGGSVVSSSAGPFTATGLCAGVQTVNIADVAQGCTRTDTYVINGPPAFNWGAATTSVACFGFCTGVAAVTPTGGTSGYTVTWNPGGTTSVITTGQTSSITGLCAGATRTASIIDSKGCVYPVNTASINGPPQLTVTSTQTNVFCPGGSNGAISVSVSGGVPAYNFVWSPGPGGNTNTIGGLPVGPQNLTITNNGGQCTNTFAFNITGPNAWTITPTIRHVNCAAVPNTGTVGLNVTPLSGNGGPYQFTWTPVSSTVVVGGGTLNATNLTAQPYSYTVADATGCTTVGVITVTAPPAYTVSATSQSLNCFGACIGAATVNISGASPAYTVTWAPGGQTTTTIGGLCVGSYTANIVDSKGCPASTVVTITQPASVTPNINTTSITCNGLCNGVITSTPGGGSSPYTFTLVTPLGASLTSGPALTASFSALCVGIHTLYITGASGCTQSLTSNVLQPNPLNASIVTTSLNCFNVCNGTAVGNVLGGTGPYTFTWTTPTGTATGAALAGQCAGNFTMTVTDANGCAQTVTNSLAQPAQITTTITPTNILCNGGPCTGILNANVAGGTPGYNLSWSNGFVGNPNTNLCVGNYTLNVTDNNGCLVSFTAAITAPPAFTITINTSSPTCAGMCTGAATITPSGGTPAYTIQCNIPPLVSNTTGILTGICPGPHVANVTDANGCSTPVNFNINNPPILSVGPTSVVNSCNVCTGAATVFASGGTPTYNIVWTGTIGVVGNGLSVSNLCTGNYTVTVTDAAGCTATCGINILQTVNVSINLAGGGILCNNACTGTAVATPTGGTGPYGYTWTPSGITGTSTANNICFGNHTVTVVDVNGCFNTATINIANPPAITVTTSQTNIACAGFCTGALSATASGGTGLLTYTWNPGNVNGQNFGPLCVGGYTLNVSDANNCTVTPLTFSVTSNPTINATFTTSNPTGCLVNNGSICATASGGNGGPYTYTWFPAGGSASCAVGLGAGAYSLIISDGVCTSTIATLLTNPTGPTLTVVTASIPCFGGNTGGATITASGGGPYSFTWSPGTPSVVAGAVTSANGLLSGTYNISCENLVTNCITSQTFAITEAASLNVVSSFTNPLCSAPPSGTITLVTSGGTPGYSFVWSPVPLAGAGTQTVSGLTTNIYTVTITDAALCPQTRTFNIVAPSAVSVSVTFTNVLCFNACNGQAVATATGGTAPINFNWLPLGGFSGSITAAVGNMCPGTYTVIATDANGCSMQTTVPITQPSQLTSTLNFVNATCSNSCNISATVTAGNGSPGYTYSWSAGPSVLSTISGLCPGAMSVTVTDSKGCFTTTAFTPTAPPQFSPTLVPTNPNCNSACTGSITTTLAGNQGTVSFVWAPAGVGQNPTGLCPGSYTLTAIDAQSCQAIAVATLANPPAVLANITQTNASCNGTCNAIAVANPTNVTAPVQYTWLPGGQNSSSITNQCPGTYTLNILDGLNCTVQAVVTLTTPPAATINPAAVPASCGFSNGAISIVVSGGTPTFNITWLPLGIPNGSVANNLGAGVYTATIVDFNNCTNTITIPLANSNGPSVTPVSGTSLSCFNVCNGSATVNVPGISGGTPGYNVTWLAPAGPANPASNLCAGTYTAQITDSSLPSNCISFTTIVIAQPSSITVNPSFTLPTCPGINNGIIELNTSGGTPGYTYSWNPLGPNNSATLTNAAAGNYTITITDNIPCPVTTITVNLPAAQNMNAVFATANDPCFGNCIGGATITPSGGAVAMNVSWSNGQFGNVATALCVGTYTALVTDGNGCFNSFTTNITSPSQITATPALSAPGCSLCNGAATITPSGGAGAPYTYAWTNGAITSTVNNICAGLYQVLITDASGICTTTQNVLVSSANGITGQTFSLQNVSCFGICNGGATVTPIGGTPAYTYSWIAPSSTISSVNNLCPGTYFVQMTDQQQCTRVASVAITAVNPLTVAPFVQPPTCSTPNGTISLVPSGGTPGYTINWAAPLAGTSTIQTNLNAGVYSATITDAAGCAMTQSFNLSNSTAPLLTGTVTNLACFGVCTGSVALTASGSTATPFSYTWSAGPSTTTSATGLCAGLITVTVTAADLCKSFQTFSISQNPKLQLSLSNAVQPLCNGDCNGVITLVPSGGTLPYSFTWTPSSMTTNPATSLCAGPGTITTYTGTVIDKLGCTTSETLNLTNPALLTAISSFTNSSCSTIADGSASVNANGGTPTLSITWAGPNSFTSTGAALNGVLAGNYTVTVVDSKSCTQINTVTIVPTITIDAKAGLDQSFCTGTTAILDGTNSIGAVSYQWFIAPMPSPSVANTPTAIVMPATGTSTYILVTTSSVAACFDQDTIIVNSIPLPVIDAGPSYTIPVFSTQGIGGSPTFNGNGTYTWSPAFTLDNGSIPNPVANNTVNTVYTLTVMDASTGCVATATMEVDLYPQIIIPNGFSPNGDARNDKWVIDNIFQFDENVVEIYNRWGELLFYKKQYNGDFDGKYNGKDLPVGTYYYVINLNHPAYPKAFTGPLTIFR